MKIEKVNRKIKNLKSKLEPRIKAKLLEKELNHIIEMLDHLEERADELLLSHSLVSNKEISLFGIKEIIEGEFEYIETDTFFKTETVNDASFPFKLYLYENLEQCFLDTANNLIFEDEGRTVIEFEKEHFFGNKEEYENILNSPWFKQYFDNKNIIKYEDIRKPILLAVVDEVEDLKYHFKLIEDIKREQDLTKFMNRLVQGFNQTSQLPHTRLEIIGFTPSLPFNYQ